jgi:hypothetical protein
VSCASGRPSPRPCDEAVVVEDLLHGGRISAAVYVGGVGA